MRYRERHHQGSSAHRGKQLPNSSSKSYSEDKSFSISSSETGPTTYQLSTESNNNSNLRASCLVADMMGGSTNAFSYKDQQTTSEVKKPVYLELKQTNAPAKTSSVSGSGPPLSSYSRKNDQQQVHYLQEQHPRASSRIYHHQQQPQQTSTQQKPKLRREFSVDG